MRWSGPTPYLCPFCKRKPGLGVLRPLGDGGQRSLVCSFCLAEWEFRRIVCPGCGEENHAKLPVYTAEELKHVRVEACDSCRTYIKTVDMTKSGLAEPIVDEMASIPLDLWAAEAGIHEAAIQSDAALSERPSEDSGRDACSVSCPPSETGQAPSLQVDRQSASARRRASSVFRRSAPRRRAKPDCFLVFLNHAAALSSASASC